MSGSRVASLVALIAAVSCAGQVGGSVPTGTRAHYMALGPVSDRYRTTALATGAVGGPLAAVAQRAMSQADAGVRTQLAPDARLGELGAWVLRAMGNDSAPPPAAVLDLWSRQLGLVEPTPHLVVLGDASESGLEQRLTAELEAAVRRQRYSHYGIATATRSGAAFAVLVMSFRFVALEQLPRSVAVGAKLQLRGTLLAGMHDAQLVVSFPDGSSARSPTARGTAFALQIPLRGTGEHRVELLAQSELGVTVVANFPLYVGVPAARAVDVYAESGASMNEAQAKARLLRLLNEERARAALPPLAPDSALDQIALAHSADMAEHHFVGHTSKTTGNADQRVARAGIRTPLVLENIGRGYSPDEVHRGLLDSPGHRANILHPGATHVGLGIVLLPEDERTAYLVTELFVRRATRLDLGRAREQLLHAIARARAQRGAHALSEKDSLSALCTDAAREFFERGKATSREQILARLNARVAKSSARPAQATAMVMVVTSPEEAANAEFWLDSHARLFGVGLAQGTRADTPEHALVVVALVGE